METGTVPTDRPQESPAADGAKKKRNLWIAGGLAGALVLGGAIATPLIMQGVRDREYAEVTAEISRTYGAVYEARADLEAATALSSLQYTEAKAYVKELTTLGKTAEPIVTKAQAKSLTEAATDAGTALGDGPGETEGRAQAVKLVQAKVDELKEADKAAAAQAKKAKKDAPAAAAPTSFLALTIDDVRNLIADESEAARTEPDPRYEGDGDVLEQARQELDAAKSELEDLELAVDEERELSSTYTEAVAGTLPVLVEVSDATPAQAKAVVAAAPKAGDKAKSVTTSADTAKKTASEKAATATQVQAKLVAYVEAAKAAQQSHKDQVAAEEAAAAQEAAEAAGASEWDGGGTGGGWDPGTGSSGGAGGGWVPPTDPGAGGGGNTWTPPVDPGNGGGGAGGGGSTGGGAGGGGSTGGGGGGGVAPPATSCPPGTYPSGSWDSVNGVHCFSDGEEGGW